MNKSLRFFTKKIFLILIISLVLTSVISIFKLTNKNERFETTSTAMGTYVTQTLCCPNAKSVCIDVNNEIKSLENQISWRIKSSDINKINASSDAIEISKSTADILSLSLDVAKNSNGAFNPAILPLAALWDFGGANNIPSEDEIKKTLPLINFSSLSVDCDNLTASLSGQSAVDLGAVGKGAACDLAIDTYKKSGAAFGVVSVGGSIGVFGHKDDNSPFKIAIRNPFDSDNRGNGFAVLSVPSGCVSTSGSYEKNFYSNGKFYHHILNSSTGYPVENDLVSVTVAHNSGVLTDLLSTACFVLGKENSRPLLEHYNAAAVFVDKNKNVFVSKKLRDNIKIVDDKFHLSDWC